MKAISKTNHANLIEALLQLEYLLVVKNNYQNDVKQTAEYRKDLEMMYINYKRLIDELAEQIATYEYLFSHVRTKHLGKKLKNLIAK